MSDPAPAPTWAPPKNPVPPHRLARLANALGVSTPMPYSPSPLLSPSYSGPSTAGDPYRRSPTPSSSSGFGFPPSTSKYLLHVIPPSSLPHDSDSFDSDFTPPPPTASGYHTQFRRGTLVPVHPTLQSQLGAIAKEYALPSTAGLILYLVSQRPAPSLAPGGKSLSISEEMEDEPGPRLSEDIWRHLWTRVVKAEMRDDGPLSPPLLGLGISNPLAGRSTPYLPRHAPPSSASSTYPLPLLSTQAPTPIYPFALTPSPTTPSSDAHVHVPRIDTKSAPPSSSDSPSPSEDPDTPATSHRADSLDLPGLSPSGSSQLIPILAKVEFDIDKRRAAWYEPWLRSRRANHAKRKESMTPSIAESSADEEAEGKRTAPLPFRLLKRNSQGKPKYLPLSESPKPMLESDDEEVPERPQNPLASDVGEVEEVEVEEVEEEADEEEVDEEEVDEEEEEEERTETRALVSHLNSDIPGMGSAPSSSRRGPPTPLVLHTPSSASPVQPESVRLPYLEGGTPNEDERRQFVDEEEEAELEMEDEDDPDNLPSSKSSHDPEKRGGGFYDDMDLGFDFDEDDPNDRRKSQFIMHQQLDAIEKSLAQFSPRKLATDDFEEQSRISAAVAVAPHLSPPAHAAARVHAVTNADVFPPTPRLPNHPDIHPEEDGSGSDNDDLSQQAAWPAVPFTSLADRDLVGNRRSQSSSAGERSPPRLAVNGVSAAMPKRFRSSSRASTASAETEARRRDMMEQYPAMTPSIGLKSSLSSPLIPLSPDPFGRHPSSSGHPSPDVFGGSSSRRASGASYWEEPLVMPPLPPAQPVVHQRNPSVAPSTSGVSGSSRFSTDSMNGDTQVPQVPKQGTRTTMMSVKTIKKLWRKSQKNSVSGPSVSTNPNSLRAISTVPENIYSPLSPPPPARPNRPSMEDMELPDLDVPVPPAVSRASPIPPALAPPRPSQEMLHQQFGVPVRRPSNEQYPIPQSQAAPPRPSQEMVQQQLGVPPVRRPSPEQFPPVPQPLGMRRPSQDHGPGPYFAPVPMLRSQNTAPIVAAKAGPPRKQSSDGLLWDQESPYPTRAASSRAPSVTSSISRPPSAASVSPPTISPSPPLADKERNSARKSILKWKATTAAGLAANGSAGGGAVPAPLTPSAATFRTRKSSITGSPAPSAPLSLPSDIPPSPKIPEQFMMMNGYASASARPNSAAIAKRRLSTKMTSTSTADSGGSSSRRGSQHHHHRAGQESMASSYASEELVERSSFDTSGFEIVSPRMGETLSFPYHDLDGQHEGVRTGVGATY
ncbi:hypothetical protein FB45DRAFT_949148 [Roridomyces roridus]|uniref:Proteophosphoglycan ppg4 n=1 Tax=Roridomyces roridus TaxID=1738132 RepID=A0AAD7B129_9AGAR|nr:hypothetical protein FB45DRAFT_949148 [Roridomyces roridus]